MCTPTMTFSQNDEVGHSTEEGDGGGGGRRVTSKGYKGYSGNEINLTKENKNARSDNNAIVTGQITMRLG